MNVAIKIARFKRKFFYQLIALIFLCRRFAFLNGLLRYINVAHGQFVTLDDFIFLQPNSLELLYRDKVTLAYSPPKFDEYVTFESILVNEMKYDQYAAAFKNASVLGGSSIIILPNKLVLYDIKSLDRNNRYSYSDPGILYFKQNNLIHKNAPVNEDIEEAIWMGGNFSWNYYHLLFEYLIKFGKLERLGLNLQIPILIDRICFEVPQFQELLSIVNHQRRQIISIDSMNCYKVKKLYYINCPNFIPPNFVNDKDIHPSDIQFDIKSLIDLKSMLLPYSSNKEFPKRFFISRKDTSGRRVFNEDEVFGILETFGFDLIVPEKLSVTDQIALFNQAECIAGGSGAAFANLLFCTKSCKAIIFSKNRLPFSGFSTIAYAVGVDIRYVTEESTKGDLLKNIHDPFVIEVEKLRRLLKEWL